MNFIVPNATKSKLRFWKSSSCGAKMEVTRNIFEYLTNLKSPFVGNRFRPQATPMWTKTGEEKACGIIWDPGIEYWRMGRLSKISRFMFLSLFTFLSLIV